MIRVGVVGATGYTGEELVKILLNHPKVKLTSLTAKLDKEQKYSDIFSKFTDKCDLICKNLNVDEVSKKVDIVFLALPHGVSMQYADAFLKKGKKVIDLSADYRLKDVSLYKKWYNIVHKDEKNLKKSIYGLPEIYKSKIEKANLIANPGCYATVSILSCLPLIAEDNIGLSEIIIDAKTGVTGAGRRAKIDLHFAEINENIKAYKLNNTHQHIPEINQELSNVGAKNIEVFFVPHLVPINRGILATTYLQYKEVLKQDEVINIYKDFYKDAPFVKVLDKGKIPQLKDVAYTNYCHIGISVNEDKGFVTIIGVIDNLLKGASGQAVENMNIMSGFKQEEGLI